MCRVNKQSISVERILSNFFVFRIESTLVSLGWSRIEDKLDESFKLKWVECKSQINYENFRDGQCIICSMICCCFLCNHVKVRLCNIVVLGKK